MNNIQNFIQKTVRYSGLDDKATEGSIKWYRSTVFISMADITELLESL